MILSCPSCKTRYIVPDSAIGPTGRRVRCANCRYSWVQDPPALDLETAPTAREAAAEPPVPAARRRAAPGTAAPAELDPQAEPAPEPDAAPMRIGSPAGGRGATGRGSGRSWRSPPAC